ncbi:MAG: sialidase family protein [Myxococcales bacterium]|nr:sialidase family protein [Myxococcales bacterium]
MAHRLPAWLVLGLLTACMGVAEDPMRPELPAGVSDADGPGLADAGPSELEDAGQSVPDAGSTTPDSGTDAGPVSVDAGIDAGPLVPDAGDRIPIFVAQGMVGRTTISCDDGRTWVADRSWDREGDSLICGSTTPIECDVSGKSCGRRWYDGSCSMSSPCDCGHSPGFSKGVAFDGTTFVGTWGWGFPGSVRRSRNGVDWTRSIEGHAGFGGIAYGAGVFVTGDRSPKVSRDGERWDAGGPANFSGPNEPIIWSVRRFAFAPYGATGRFVAVASGNRDRDILISSDRGQTWWRPHTLPADCGGDVGAYGDIVGGNGVIVMAGSNRTICRSTDGGETWTRTTIASEIYSSGLWTGSQFWFWSRTARWSSPDGLTWTSTPLTPAVSLGPVARSPDGTLVAVANVWEGYRTQRFLRSTDGVSWQILPTTAFNGSHPIFFITWGLAERSSLCP